jgi:hypothetical protein
MTTKELIYTNALDLWSKHGYQQFGMRDLAKSVGIRASSIYNHYHSKEEILLEIADTLKEEMKKDVYPLFKKANSNPREFFTNISLGTNHFFEQPHINQLVKILLPEQQNHEALKKIIHEEFFVKPRSAFNYYFKNLSDKGIMKIKDANIASRLYHSYFVYHFYEKLLLPNGDKYLTSNEDLFTDHINFFLDYAMNK